MADQTEPIVDSPTPGHQAGSSQAPQQSPSAPASSSVSTLNQASSSSQSHTLLWSKSKVYVHPSPYAKHNVPGYLALSRAGPSRPGAKILLSFLPESLVEQRQELEKFVRIEYTTSARAGDDTQLHEPRKSLDTVEEDEDDPGSMLIAEPPTSSTYAFSLPLTSIYGFMIKKPTISSWYGTVTISQVGGLAMPTLHFHDDESKSTVLSMHRAKQSATADAAAAASASRLQAEDAKKLSAMPNSSSWSAASSHRASPRPTSPSPTWGGDELVQQLRKYANVHRSALEPNLFLVNPSRTDLETHSTPLFDDDAIDMPNPNPANAAWSHDLSDNAYSMSPLHQSLPSNGTPGRRNNDLAMDNLTVWAKSARMSVLSSFANFTQQARHASHTVLSHPLARPYASHLPGPVQSFAQAGPVPLGPNEGEWEWRESSIANTGGSGEYFARVYLARWARLVAEEGERNRRKEERLGANMGDAALAASANTHGEPSSSGGARTEGSELGPFEVLEKIYDLPRPTSEREARFADLKLDPDSTPPSSVGLDAAEWRSFFDPDTGRPMYPAHEIRHRIFVNGLTDQARKLAWPYLLDAIPFGGTSESRAAIWEQKEVEYHYYKARWQTDDDLLATDAFREQRHRVRVDCLRTDRTHPLFARDPAFIADPDADPMRDPNSHIARLGEILLTYGLWESEHPSSLQDPASDTTTTRESLLAGYVQGMSDLCSPLYIACEGDEVATFWCFVGFMERTKSNFYRDQSGMKTQLLVLQKLISIMDPALYAHLEKTESLHLFFCYRWLLVRFKREFRFDQTMTLWEACWAAEPSASPTSSTPQATPSSAIGDGENKDEESVAQDRGEWTLSRSFHIFCALALLEQHRDYIIRYLEHFDEILQYFNSLTGEFDVNAVICKAEVLAKSFREVVLRSQSQFAEEKTEETHQADSIQKHHDSNKQAKNIDFLHLLTQQELQILL
ncbi:related to GYP7 - GTPase-activating protein for Ypt7p [Ustilago trichophora]|uniref:Related to GYP7 - GTPase-activating protein for Ypt7p n=1 Tax=Ustilago trichophora TaxID=86804 RepID=A0A5C3E556_9BASI|nr:related to GYP7 - GTPase-activating protein for Ypt7p [Ustilago trichophora]